MANRGTFEGDEQEILFVQDFNKNKNSEKYAILRKNIECDFEHVYAVRVTTSQHSTLSDRKTKTRADCYLIHCQDENINPLLNENNCYLDEERIKNLDYKSIESSGISIKIADSTKFQILKLVPDSFHELFGCYELGAGASLYCKKDSDLSKNEMVLKGWKTTIQEMTRYFELGNRYDFVKDKTLCKRVKEQCNRSIVELIDKSCDLQKKIFNGDPIYEQPYSAWYIYSSNQISKLDYIPFSVTTGSGRSRGDFTIVLKPKK